MKALITGAAGQVGVELCAALAKRGDTVVATDVVPRPPQVPTSTTWRTLDVTDAKAVEHVIHEVRPDVVFHFAAILSAGGEKDPQMCWHVNMDGTFHVLEACRTATPTPRVIFASTIAAFGPGLPEKVPNEVSMRPSTMYGVTKVAGELLGEYYFAKYELDFRAVRYPGLISAGLPGAGTSDYALFMYVNGIRDGHYAAFCKPETRIPFMYMPDAIRSVVELSQADRRRMQRCTYNIQGFSPRADEIAYSVVEGAKPQELRITFDPVEWRQKILDSWPRALDDSAARDEWGWRPEYDLAAMTKDVIPRVREMLAQGLLQPQG